MDASEPQSLEALMAFLGKPAYGGPFANTFGKSPLGFVHESPYDDFRHNDWVGWHCAPDAERTGNYCYAVLVNSSPERWALLNVCTAHRGSL